MEAQKIGIKKLHKDMTYVVDEVRNGQRFLVVKNSQPVFRIEPVEPVPAPEPKRSFDDFAKAIQAEVKKVNTGGNLSKEVDSIVYGV